jgi:hypothetical protein
MHSLPPHSRYKLETVSVRMFDFVVVMPITRGKQSFLPCSHASWSHRCSASWLHGFRVAMTPLLAMAQVACGGPPRY